MDKLIKCKACGKEIAKGVNKCVHCGKDQRNFFMKHKIITIILALAIIGGIGSAMGGNKDQTANSTSTGSSSAKTSNSTSNNTDKSTAKTEVKQRQVQGKAIDLGAGTFAVGKDIEEGSYDVTPVEGQGNFAIQNTQKSDLMVNEILGDSSNMGVSKVRVKLVKDEQIQLESINKTHFEPVTAAFATEHKAAALYTGRWVVGEDVGSGRYVAAPKGGSGNFVVYNNGMPKVNEILGDNGVKQVTINLEEGDIITVASLNEVDLTPQ